MFYAFEAKSIQNYLFSGGKLKHVVGGSDLVDRICQYPEALTAAAAKAETDLIGQIIAQLDLPSFEDKKFSRRAGGAFIVGSIDLGKLTLFRQTLHQVLTAKIPGLQFVDAVIEGEDIKSALSKMHDELNASRNRQINAWPHLNPFIEEDKRTGRAATNNSKYADEGVLDPSRWTKEKNKLEGRDSVGAKFLSKDDLSKYIWPNDLKDICTLSGSPDKNGVIALVHADGNSLGRLIQEMASQGIDNAGFRAFSEAISKATRLAAREATEDILLPAAIKNSDQKLSLPARPLVLGGDDLSIFIRGDLALPFTKKFLAQFEKTTKRAFENLKGVNVAKLSAGAGILYMNSKFPFDQCADLAEVLAKQAKTEAKVLAQINETGYIPSRYIPSSLLFHRNTFSLAGNKEQIEQDITIQLKNQMVRLGAGPYFLSQYPSLDGFETVCEKLLDEDEKVSGIGALREAVGLLQTNPSKAQQKYDRWVTVTKQRNKDYFKELMELVAECLGVKDVTDRGLLIATLPNRDNKVCLLADVLLKKAVDDG